MNTTHNKDSALVLDAPLDLNSGSAVPNGFVHHGGDTHVAQHGRGDKAAPASPTPHPAASSVTALAASASASAMLYCNSHNNSFSAPKQTGPAACACPCPGSESKKEETGEGNDGNTEASPATATTHTADAQHAQHAQHGPTARSGAEILAPKPTHNKAATLPLDEGDGAEAGILLRTGRAPRSTTGLVDARVSTMSAPPIPLRRASVVFPDTTIHSNTNPTTMATAMSTMNSPPVPVPAPHARSTSGSLRLPTSARRWTPPSPSSPSPLGTAVITGSYFDPRLRARDRDVCLTDDTADDDVLMTPTADDADMDSPNTVGIDTRRLNLLPIHTPPPALRRASLPLPRTPDANDAVVPASLSPSTPPPPTIGTGLGLGLGLGLHGGSPTVAETGLHCPGNGDSPGPASGQLERRPPAAKNGGRIIRLDSFGGVGLERKPSGRA